MLKRKKVFLSSCTFFYLYLIFSFCFPFGVQFTVWMYKFLVSLASQNIFKICWSMVHMLNHFDDQRFGSWLIFMSFINLSWLKVGNCWNLFSYFKPVKFQASTSMFQYWNCDAPPGKKNKVSFKKVKISFVSHLLPVKLFDYFIVCQGIQVLHNHMEDKPVSNLLSKGKGMRLQDGLNVRPLSRLSTLWKKFINYFEFSICWCLLQSLFTLIEMRATLIWGPTRVASL